LFQSGIIKKITAVLFLTAFVLGNMPRQFFHEALANHRDTVSDCNHAQKAMGCIHQVNFNCHYDTLVVNTVYVVDTPDSPTPLTSLQTDHFTLSLSTRSSSLPENNINRGPPAFLLAAVNI